MKKDSVDSSALDVTSMEEHRACFKGSRALTGGNRSSAHHGSAPRKVTPGQPGFASNRTPRVWVRRPRPRPQVRAQGLRRRLSCCRLRYVMPRWGGQFVMDSQRSVCGEPVLAPSTQPDASRHSRGAGDLAASVTEELKQPCLVLLPLCPSRCVCPHLGGRVVAVPSTCGSALSAAPARSGMISSLVFTFSFLCWADVMGKRTVIFQLPNTL